MVPAKKNYKVEGNLIDNAYAESLGWNLEKFKNYIIKELKTRKVYIFSDKNYIIITFNEKDLQKLSDRGFRRNENLDIIKTICLGSNFDCYQFKRKIKLVNKSGNIEILTGEELEDIRYLEVSYNNIQTKEFYVAGI